MQGIAAGLPSNQAPVSFWGFDDHGVSVWLAVASAEGVAALVMMLSGLERRSASPATTHHSDSPLPRKMSARDQPPEPLLHSLGMWALWRGRPVVPLSA